MVKDAEEHAAEDKQRREEAETRNTAEQLAYSVEKLIKDNEDKLSDEVKTEVQADVDALKTALAGEDIEAIKSAQEKLMESQGKLGEAIYSQASEEAPAEDAEPEEDVVDAEVIDDEEEKTEESDEEKK
jgi:molecular chaperone DnaK